VETGKTVSRGELDRAHFFHAIRLNPDQAETHTNTAL
jgi:hypothetical protein